LANFEGNSRYAEYDNFRVASAADKYRLVSLGTYSGTAGRYNYGKFLGGNVLSCEVKCHV